jgi:short-subunit dehydrogenase
MDMGQFPLSKKFKDVVERCVAEGGDIRVLVNNAGVSHDMPVTFGDMSREEMEGIMGINNGGVLRATKDVLPFMMNDRCRPVSRLILPFPVSRGEEFFRIVG